MNQNSLMLEGLVAATHAPFHSDGRLNLAGVEKQAAHLLKNGVEAVFINGTTGESLSLSLDERLSLAKRWSEVAHGTSIRSIVHVGSHSLVDASAMASQAQAIGAVAIAAVAPSYFKPKDVAALVACCAQVAANAPALPFYYYHIPEMTDLHLSTPDFLAQGAKEIPTLAGIKFSHTDLMSFQRCLNSEHGKFDILWGIDECLMAALALGARGAVGNTYNYTAPLYHRMMKAFSQGDFATARREQHRSAELVALLTKFGFSAASKHAMSLAGVDVGPPRLPITALTTDQKTQLEADLTRLGFFDWIKTS